MKKVTKKQLGATTKKYQTGGPSALKKAIADSTEADKHYFYAKQNARNLRNPEGTKYIQELQAKMEAPGKIRKQMANSGKDADKKGGAIKAKTKKK